ncbi:HAD-IIB family hydrolase [Phycisphaera mikurensis]|uniref:HAD-IIB family hydrolase n=1 Tax=Phycisphaera mikurensis TaxID=547188 RepID=UPI001C8756D8|nr:HAD family hydrolase [Phycisphaera mikurensis]
MLAVDLDGTLLQRDGRVRPDDLAALRRAAASGVAVVVATARPPRAVPPELRVFGPPVVHYNGALILGPGGMAQPPLLHRPIGAGTAAEVARLARRLAPGCSLDAEVLDAWHTDRVNAALTTATSAVSTPDRVAPLAELFDRPITKLMVLDEPASVDRLIAALRGAASLTGRARVVVSDAHLLQVVHPRVDKAAAVAWVAGRLGLGPADIDAVGDAPNDADMLRGAARSVCVGDGWEEARAAADEVGPPLAEGPVGWAVRRWYG